MARSVSQGRVGDKTCREDDVELSKLKTREEIDRELYTERLRIVRAARRSLQADLVERIFLMLLVSVGVAVAVAGEWRPSAAVAVIISAFVGGRLALKKLQQDERERLEPLLSFANDPPSESPTPERISAAS
jgi:hypothetical protein